MEKPVNTFKIVCISDTHDKINELKNLPEGDVLIHAGDFTHKSSLEEIEMFNKWLSKQPHPIKIVIAGNHDILFDIENNQLRAKAKGFPVSKDQCAQARKLLTNCTYLQDSFITVHGYKIYGSPWTPYHRGLAFNASEDLIKEIWKNYEQ